MNLENRKKKINKYNTGNEYTKMILFTLSYFYKLF